jgi:hypothetical protein
MMSQDPHSIDGLLVQWGDRLFYPANRIVKVKPQPRLPASLLWQRAAAIRARIEATVVRRAPQVMVKVTGGGRGMKAIAAHFKYISKNGRLEIENERGEKLEGREALHDLGEEWRFGGTLIDDVGFRREALNIMLSMPRGTDPLTVQSAAREVAQAEFADHKYVMVLHDHQANPHVHLSVRAESRHGWRLNPRKADLQRWRETFAEKLRGWGVDAEATRRTTRGSRTFVEPLWRIKARGDGRLRVASTIDDRWHFRWNRGATGEAWRKISEALVRSDNSADRELANRISKFVRGEALSPPRESARQSNPQSVPAKGDVNRDMW